MSSPHRLRGDGGRAFFIKDQEGLTFRAFIAAIADLQGLSIAKLRSIPYWLASAMGRLLDTIWPSCAKRAILRCHAR